MISTHILGINKNAIPLSDAFNIDTIDSIITIEEESFSINKIMISTSYKYLDSFKMLGKSYVNILIDINIRTDYLCISKNIHYNIHKIQRMVCICSDNLMCNKNMPIKIDILDGGVIDIYENKIFIYLLYLISIDVC